MNGVARWVVSLLLIGLAGLACAQNVRREYRISGSATRGPNSIADESAVDWPTLEPETTGTQIHITSDFHNSDIAIYTFKSYGPDRLFSLGQRLAIHLGVPKTDFIYRVGRRLAAVDLEFNRTIRYDDNRSFSQVEVGRAVDFLVHQDLPKPIGVYIRVEKGDFVQFAGKKLEKSIILAPKDVPVDAVRLARSERHWYGLVVGVGFAIFFSIFPIWMCSFTLRNLKGARANAPPAAVSPKSLSEAQSKYQGLKGLRSIWPLLLIPVLGSPIFTAPIEDAFKWIPPAIEKWIMIFPFVMLVPVVIQVVLSRRAKKDHTSPQPAGWMPRMGLLMAPMIPLMAIFLLQNIAPQLFWRVSPTAFRIFVFSLPVVSFVAFAYLTWRDSKRQLTVLTPGDEDYDATMKWARASGAKVTKVVILKSESANASAMFGGRVTITSAAREKLTREERAAVLAHEVGHVRRQHVAKALLVSCVVLFVVNFVIFRQLDARREQYPSWAQVAIDTMWITPLPIMFIVNAVMAPMRKRAEYEADRFALEAVGDFSTLARALAKIHLLNGSPHTRMGLDEYLASHPSLTKRLARLKETAIALGMSVPANLVGELIEAPLTE